MSRPLIHDDFLLGNDQARELYHCHAAHQPIIDYHNHLPVAQIAANHQFGDLAELWLAGDHYKWRAMRANGISERLITGNAAPEEKFRAWASTVPYTLRNPLYHWTHLELARHFGIKEQLNRESAAHVWCEASAQLPHLRVHDLLGLHRVRILCTTDDPADPLEGHRAILAGNLRTRVYPTFRPDAALKIHEPIVFSSWISRLEQTAATSIVNFDDLLSVLKKRHDDFHGAGCRLSDHSLQTFPSASCSEGEAAKIFRAVRSGNVCTRDEESKYASFLMLEFGRWNAARGWTLQLHLGSMRNTNTRLFHSFGPDAGCDSISDFSQAEALASYLDALDSTSELPRTILYNLNPSDTYVFATIAGNFQDGSLPGKIQLGSGWWFLDQKEGIEWQLNAISNLGLLRRFVGMVTDSRSFLSFTRHEYFRRILCNLLGQGMAAGELPSDMLLVGQMVEEICFTNARDYFGFDVPANNDQ